MWHCFLVLLNTTYYLIVICKLQIGPCRIAKQVAPFLIGMLQFRVKSLMRGILDSCLM